MTGPRFAEGPAGHLKDIIWETAGNPTEDIRRAMGGRQKMNCWQRKGKARRKNRRRRVKRYNRSDWTGANNRKWTLFVEAFWFWSLLIYSDIGAHAFYGGLAVTLLNHADCLRLERGANLVFPLVCPPYRLFARRICLLNFVFLWQESLFFCIIERRAFFFISG